MVGRTDSVQGLTPRPPHLAVGCVFYEITLDPQQVVESLTQNMQSTVAII